MKGAVKLSVKGFKNTWYCRALARALVFVMLIHGSPLPILSQTYQWDPNRLHAVFTRAIDWWRHGEAHGAAAEPNSDFVDSVWVAFGKDILKVAADDGSILLKISNLKNIRSIAVDEQRTVLWAASHKTLFGLDFDGALRLTVPVPRVSRKGNGVTCTVDSVGGDVCVDRDGKKRKPQALVFEYTGDGCAGSNNSQSSKSKCSDSVDGASMIGLRIAKGHYLQLSQDSVALGGEFTITSAKGFPSEIVLDLISGRLKESNKIHTSCSKPLAVGDQFGSLLLVGFTPSAGHDREGHDGKDDDRNKKGDKDDRDKDRGEKHDRDKDRDKHDEDDRDSDRGDARQLRNSLL